MIKFETGMSVNNLPHWGKLETLKEFIQNMVYAKTILGDEGDISCEPSSDSDITTIIIKNYPSGFPKGSLLIGESTQAGVVGAPGNWGEGMKAGMCVGLRDGLSIKIVTNGYSVVPSLEPSTLDSSVNTLHMTVEDNDFNEGTTVTISGNISAEDIKEATRTFAVLDGISMEDVARNCILHAKKDSMYVNGVKICSHKSIFSYNFTDASLINRDRTSVDTDKVREAVAEMLSCITEKVYVIKILEGILKDDSLLESQSGIAEFKCSKSLWLECLHTLFGDKIAISSGGEHDNQARYRNYNLLTNIPSNWSYFFRYYLDIPTAQDLSQSIAYKPIYTKSKDAEDITNLGVVKRQIKTLIGDYGTIKTTQNLQDGHRNLCKGLWDRDKDIIWIDMSVLSDRKELFTVVLHEVVHRLTGALDNTSSFTRGWEEACWLILNKGKDKDKCVYLKQR